MDRRISTSAEYVEDVGEAATRCPVILHMLWIGATQCYHDPLKAGINDGQELSKTHEPIARAKTAIQHRILTDYIPLYFPEIERFRGNSRSDWFFAFLDAIPTPANITSLSKEAFIEATWDVVGRKVSKERNSVLRRSNPRAEPPRGDMVLTAGSFFLCLAFCRTRFGAWVTRSRG